MTSHMTRRETLARMGAGVAATAAALGLLGCNDQHKPDQPADKTGKDQPATAPQGKDLRKYVCGKCGYVYDPARSTPPKAFADLPAEWKCPRCRSPKSRFSPKA